ncbi:MAG: CAP domain-containing protein [Acutalibacteraceae bacterium]
MKKNKLLVLIVSVLSIFVLCSVSASALQGDVNNDGIIDTKDASYTLFLATNINTPTEYQEIAADANCDGVIDTIDVRLILRHASNIELVEDHLFADFEVQAEATCTETGLKTAVCVDCGKVITREIPPKGHTLVTEILTAPTCTTEGSELVTCTECDLEYEQIIPPTGHNSEDVTCTDGAYCPDCNEYLPPLGHNEVNGTCTRCGTVISSPHINYKGKSVSFGSTTDVVELSYGSPQEILTDNNNSSCIYTVYIYYTDYNDLATFTFTNNKLSQFYTNDASASVSQGSGNYRIADGVINELGNMDIFAYVDEIGTNSVYAFSAKLNGTASYRMSESSDYEVHSKIVFHVTNGVRAINGVKPLIFDEAASKVAIAHSKDMADNNYFAHENLQGDRASDRLTAAGIEWYSCGENIIAGYTDPYYAVCGWYNSQGHRNNILNNRFEKLGVGYAYNSASDYYYYGTQLFYTDS